VHTIIRFVLTFAVLLNAGLAPAVARSLPRDTLSGAVCIDRRTGKLLWQHFPEKPGGIALIAGEGGAWMLAKNGTKLHRLDVATGKLAWSKPVTLWDGFRWQVWSRPTGEVVKTGDRRLLALTLPGHRRRRSEGLALIDGETAEVLASHAGSLVRTKTAFVLLDRQSHTVRSVDGETGKTRWTTKLAANALRPLPDGDLLAVNGLWIARLGRNDGSIAWRCKVPRENDGDRQLWWTEIEHVTEDVAVVKGEDLLVKNHREILASIDLHTGELRWTHRRFHFLTRYPLSSLRFLQGLYRDTYAAADFPSVIVDGRIGFCDGNGLAEYRLMGESGRRVWPREADTAKYEVWFYAPAGDGGWHVGAVESATGRGLLVRVARDTKELWRIEPEDVTLTRPLFERDGVLWADHTAYEGKRGPKTVRGFSTLALDSRTGKQLARLPSLTSHLDDGWDACLERGLLPCRNRLRYGVGVRPQPPMLAAVSLKDRKVAWTFTRGRFSGSPELLAAGDGHHVWKLGTALAPLDLATGKPAWHFDAGHSYQMGRPAFLGDRILLPSPPRDEDGKLRPLSLTRER
jgi:outer membrane protein assembly factor BamB